MIALAPNDEATVEGVLYIAVSLLLLAIFAAIGEEAVGAVDAIVAVVVVGTVEVVEAAGMVEIVGVATGCTSGVG